jgi:ethanolamine ammonia-lyase large subunit
MGDKVLVLAASWLWIVTKCRKTTMLPEMLGVRIQPNHSLDVVRGILLSTIDALRHQGCDARAAPRSLTHREEIGPVEEVDRGAVFPLK